MGRNLLIGDKVRVTTSNGEYVERTGILLSVSTIAGGLCWVFFDEGADRFPKAFYKSELTYDGPLRRTAWEHLVQELDETV